MNDRTITHLLEQARALPAPLNLEFDGREFVKTCHHVFADPPSPTQTAMALAELGIATPPFIEFYEICNGFTLFKSPTDDTDDGSYFIPPIRIFRIEELAGETLKWRKLISEMSPDDYEPFCAGGVVFGEAEGTGNPFVVMPQARLAGQIFYADGDPDINDWANNVLALSLRDFLRAAIEPPLLVLTNTCGAVRAWV